MSTQETKPEPRRPKLRLPFDNRREDAGEWAFDHRAGLCVTLIAYLLLAIAFVGAKIVVGGRPAAHRRIGLPLRKTHKQNESPRTLPATLIRRRIFCTAAPRTARRDSPAPHLVPIPDGATIAIPTLREEARKIPAQGSTAAIPAPPSRRENEKAGRPKPSRKKTPSKRTISSQRPCRPRR